MTDETITDETFSTGATELDQDPSAAEPETLEELADDADVAADTDVAPERDEAPDATFDLTEEGDEAEEAPRDTPWLRPGKWYVVHTQSGYEKKVQANLNARIQCAHLDDQILEVVMPIHDLA